MIWRDSNVRILKMNQQPSLLYTGLIATYFFGSYQTSLLQNALQNYYPDYSTGKPLISPNINEKYML